MENAFQNLPCTNDQAGHFLLLMKKTNVHGCITTSKIKKFCLKRFKVAPIYFFFILFSASRICDSHENIYNERSQNPVLIVLDQSFHFLVQESNPELAQRLHKAVHCRMASQNTCSANSKRCFETAEPVKNKLCSHRVKSQGATTTS